MTAVIANRVMETSTTTGTGAYTLAGAVTGFQTFAAAPAVNGDTVDYFAEDVNASTGVPTGGWESGTGTWGTGGILTRTSIESSSNAGSAVSWAAGTRRIGLTLTAGAAKRARNGSLPFLDLGSVSGAVTLDLSLAHAFALNLSAAATLTITNPAAGVLLEQVVIQIITNGNTVTWPASIAWAKATAPTNYMSGKTLISLPTVNNGTSYSGVVLNPSYESVTPSSAWWRIYVTANNGDTAVEIAEVFFMLSGSVVSVPANIVTTNQSSYSTNGGNRLASWMWDGTVGTAEINTWCSSEGVAMPQWASVQYSAGITADAIKIYPTVYNPTTRSTRDFAVQKSVDGTTWVTVKSWTAMNSWTVGTGVTLSLL